MQTPDLNLLYYLDLLVTYRSATRVAEVLDISQPAVSAALRRLRTLTRDPLFLRTGRQLVPTTRAHELQSELKPLLEKWAQLQKEPEVFNPSVSTRRFSILASDYIQYLFLPPLAQRLSRKAPEVHLRVIPSNPYKGLTLLAEHHVDLAIGYFHDAPTGLKKRRILEEPAMCLLSMAHPAAKRFDRAAYAKYRHLSIVSSSVGSYSKALEKALARHHIVRHIAMVIPSYVTAAHIVAKSEYIATLPKSIAEAAAQMLPVTVLPCPFELPTLDLSIFFPKAIQDDPGHQWLRNEIAECAVEIANRTARRTSKKVKTA